LHFTNNPVVSVITLVWNIQVNDVAMGGFLPKGQPPQSGIRKPVFDLPSPTISEQMRDTKGKTDE
jgi:hypothetical protein